VRDQPPTKLNTKQLFLFSTFTRLDNWSNKKQKQEKKAEIYNFMIYEKAAVNILLIDLVLVFTRVPNGVNFNVVCCLCESKV
jgi:hypothetical protein